MTTTYLRTSPDLPKTENNLTLAELDALYKNSRQAEQDAAHDMEKSTVDDGHTYAEFAAARNRWYAAEMYRREIARLREAAYRAENESMECDCKDLPDGRLLVCTACRAIARANANSELPY